MQNQLKLIFLDYICSCKSGRKQVGCCIHVASYIFYLSYGRYREKEIRSPGKYLNSVLINMSKMQSPNKPNYARNKRYKKEEFSSDLSENRNTSNFESNDYIGTQQCELSENNDKENNSCDERRVVKPGDLTLEEFKDHIPKWSAEISYKGFQNVKVVNTCTIDYFLFALWVLYKKAPTFLNSSPTLEPEKTLKAIILYIDFLKWNEARELWIVNIMKYDKNPKDGSISLYGSEYEMFLKYLLHNQLHNLIQICEKNCSNTNKTVSKQREILMFKKTKNQVSLHTYQPKKCSNCKAEIKTEFQFIRKPNLLFIESPGNIFINDIPPMIHLDNSDFKWFCTTLHKRNHFLGVFEINGIKYVVDDLNKNAVLLTSKNSNSRENYFNIFTGTSMYFLE